MMRKFKILIYRVLSTLIPNEMRPHKKRPMGNKSRGIQWKGATLGRNKQSDDNHLPNCWCKTWMSCWPIPSIFPPSPRPKSAQNMQTSWWTGGKYLNYLLISYCQVLFAKWCWNWKWSTKCPTIPSGSQTQTSLHFWRTKGVYQGLKFKSFK